MDWILILAIATFALLLAFLLWNRSSLKRHQTTGSDTSGIGGLSDPMSGTTEGMRPPDEMRADMDAAASPKAQAERTNR
ncbi:hypothetical protein [Rhodopila sp.]|uniref:hypothetical protein n=1 Tax=Rhodopila sp. TaxID=2480087 RepID=UPI003D0F52A5